MQFHIEPFAKEILWSSEYTDAFGEFNLRAKNSGIDMHFRLREEISACKIPGMLARLPGSSGGRGWGRTNLL